MFNSNEIWKPIINYENIYEISNFGRVKRLIGYRCRKERILRPREQKSGHLYVSLCKNNVVKNYRIHRLVLSAFMGQCPPGTEGCHNDGDPKNNKLENLRYDTHRNNMQDSIKHGTIANHKGSRSGMAKLNEWQVRIIKRLLEDEYLTPKEIAGIFKISRQAIYNIKWKRRWRHINE